MSPLRIEPVSSEGNRLLRLHSWTPTAGVEEAGVGARRRPSEESAAKESDSARTMVVGSVVDPAERQADQMAALVVRSMFAGAGSVTEASVPPAQPSPAGVARLQRLI